jgi:hypothetical protein
MFRSTRASSNLNYMVAVVAKIIGSSWIPMMKSILH